MEQIKTPSETALVLPVPRQPKFLSWEVWEPVIKLLVIFSGIGVIFAALKNDILFNLDFQQLLKVKSPFVRDVFILNSIIFIISLILRTFLWFKYRPYDSQKISQWPEVTVLVPSYNEGDTVYTTICSIARSDYPQGKMKIIAVDDGSTDDTFIYMDKAREEHPDMVELVRFETNKGKRRGLYESFNKSVTPYIITIDSDTRLEPDSIKELLTPLILDSTIGAVTGRIKIWNGDANLFTKILKANFAMAFDFTRAIQSTYSTVFCTSGAFSAYRRSVLLPIIDAWLNQTFLNRPCTFGEDRSLANHILREGHGTVFQRTAIAFTKVPERFTKIIKMMTRWARSNIRESYVFSTLMFNRRRKGNYILPFLEFFFTTAIVITHLALFYYFLFSGFIDAEYIFRTIAYTVIFGFFYMLYYIRIEGKKDFPYIIAFSIFSTIFMIWIFTAAGFTITRRGWSTR